MRATFGVVIVVALVAIVMCESSRDKGSVAEQSAASQPGSGSGEKDFSFAIKGEPESLDPSMIKTADAGKIIDALFQGLTDYGLDGKLIGGVADRWEVSEDGLTYTFHFHGKAKWSDGRPVTPQDFRYSWLRVLDPQTAAPYAQMLWIIKGGEAFNSGNGPAEQVAIEAVGDDTLRVTS